MAVLDPIEPSIVEQVARALGDTGEGFTGQEIARLLADCGIPDPGDTTKWRRIDTALRDEQSRSRSGNCVVSLAAVALRPVRWLGRPVEFEAMRRRANQALAFCGVEIGKDGQARRRDAARTHDEAFVVSRRLRDKLQQRGSHPDVNRYCTAELVADDCFGAVFEAVKRLGERVRQMAGADLDGNDLIRAAFEGHSPMIAFNTLQTHTERNEQRGLASIMRGVFSAFRNPPDHEPRILWHLTEEDALDLLSTLCLLHRRLDRAVVLRGGPLRGC